MNEEESTPRGADRLRGSTNVLAGAIVVAGGLVGLGLYLGLRAGAPAPEAPNASSHSPDLPTASVAPIPSSSSPSLSPVPIAATVTSSVKVSPEKAVAEAKTAMLAQWSGPLKKACWGPIVAKAAEPKTSVHRVVLGFDAAGHEVARGISDVRDKTSRPDVGGCLRALPPDTVSALAIAAPGEPLQVELELSFP